MSEPSATGLAYLVPLVGVAITAIVTVAVDATVLWLDARRAKRWLAVKILQDWVKEYEPRMKAAVDLVAHLKSDDVTKVFSANAENGGPVLAGSAIVYFDLFLARIGSPKKVADNDGLSLDHCSSLTYEWGRFLNTIEAICIAWHSDAAEQELMIENFAPLVAQFNGEIRKLLRGVPAADLPSDHLPTDLVPNLVRTLESRPVKYNFANLQRTGKRYTNQAQKY